MTQAIRDAGFTPVPEDVRLTLTGTLESRDGRVALVLDGMTAPREVPCVGAKAFSAHAGGKVEVQGRWLFNDEGSLEVESISPVPLSP
jgi:hypothetical protein